MGKYKIVEHSTQDGLVKLVNKSMEEGWAPIGGLEVYKNELRIIFYAQALTKN